jgi:transcriptional regulator with XRE-family HTH domain
MTANGGSVAQRFASFPRGAQELSAARLARDAVAALEKAFTARGCKQKELASDLGLTEGAVSQVLNGDGNVRIATLGRYLRALGYEARLHLDPVDPQAPPVNLAAGPRPRTRARIPAAPAPCAVSTIPGSRSDSWTVLDSGGDVFGVHVKFHESSSPGRQSFSGECKVMKPLHFKESTSSASSAAGPSGEALEKHARLMSSPR